MFDSPVNAGMVLVQRQIDSLDRKRLSFEIVPVLRELLQAASPKDEYVPLQDAGIQVEAQRLERVLSILELKETPVSIDSGEDLTMLLARFVHCGAQSLNREELATLEWRLLMTSAQLGSEDVRQEIVQDLLQARVEVDLNHEDILKNLPGPLSEGNQDFWRDDLKTLPPSERSRLAVMFHQWDSSLPKNQQLEKIAAFAAEIFGRKRLH